MIKFRPELPSMPSQPRYVIALNDLERNILIKLLHHKDIEKMGFSTIAIRRFREMAHELERE